VSAAENMRVGLRAVWLQDLAWLTGFSGSELGAGTEALTWQIQVVRGSCHARI